MWTAVPQVTSAAAERACCSAGCSNRCAARRGTGTRQVVHGVLRRHVGVARGQALGDGAGRGVRLVRRVDQRVGRAGDGAELDRRHVVEHAAPVRVAGQVPAEDPEVARLVGRRRDRHVQPQQVGLHRPGVVLEARDDAGRDAGQQDRQRGRRAACRYLSAPGSGTRPGTGRAAARPARDACSTRRTARRRPGAWRSSGPSARSG